MTKREAIDAGSKLNQRTLPPLNQFFKQFPDEEACRAHFAQIRWPEGVRCPRCNNDKVAAVKGTARWQCRKCDKNGYRFSLTSGTIFENTKYPLHLWFQVMYMMLQSKKGMSALQIHRQLGSGDYRTAWYMCQRIRSAFQSDEILQLSGEVEVDETFIGGKEKNKHRSKRGKRGHLGKTEVIGAIARKGNVVCQVIEQSGFHTYDNFVKQAVSSDVSLIASDESTNYRHLRNLGFPHHTVNHNQGEYVRGAVHTAHLDSFWSLLKRGIMGTYHKVSKQYLPLYVNEFAFRHNNRRNPDLFDHVLSSC